MPRLVSGASREPEPGRNNEGPRSNLGPLSFSLSRQKAGKTVTCVDTSFPHASAVIRVVPGRNAETTPALLTVATVGSDDRNSQTMRSVRNSPNRFVARTFNWTVSARRGGECTGTDLVAGRKASRTGFVMSHRKPGPCTVSSSQARSPVEAARSAIVNALRFISVSPKTRDWRSRPSATTPADQAEGTATYDCLYKASTNRFETDTAPG